MARLHRQTRRDSWVPGSWRPTLMDCRSYGRLKRNLLIARILTLDSNVWRGKPSFAAAPLKSPSWSIRHHALRRWESELCVASQEKFPRIIHRLHAHLHESPFLSFEVMRRTPGMAPRRKNLLKNQVRKELIETIRLVYAGARSSTNFVPLI